MKSHSAENIVGKLDPEPMVGIFWLFKGELIFDVTPVSSAESYGECVGHAKSHIAFWTELQRAGVISLDTEYEEPPRGRVVHNVRTGQYIVYADKCIRAKPAVVRRIIRDFSLPTELTVVTGDVHYRCRTCLSEDPNQAR
jgi:hypothetical protein